MGDILRNMFSQVIAQHCLQVGFERITEASLDLLIDVLYSYMRNLGLQIVDIAELCGGPPCLKDGLLALQLLGESPQALQRFVERTAPFFTPPPMVYCNPLYGKVQLCPFPQINSENDVLSLNTAESNDSPQQPELLDPTESGNDNVCKGGAKPPYSSSASTSSATSIRTLPSWAGPCPYRLTRISIDPINKNLIEHDPPEKHSETFNLSPELLISKHFDNEMTNQHASSQSSSPLMAGLPSAMQSSSDAQWAAALQATPAPQPAKRIVYTPRRFDPSSLSVHGSSLHRSVLSSSTQRRLVSRQSFELSKVSRISAGKMATASPVTKKKKRTTFNRSRRWTHGRRVNDRIAHSKVISRSDTLFQPADQISVGHCTGSEKLTSPIGISLLRSPDAPTPAESSIAGSKTYDINKHETNEASYMHIQGLPKTSKMEEAVSDRPFDTYSASPRSSTSMTLTASKSTTSSSSTPWDAQPPSASASAQNPRNVSVHGRKQDRGRDRPCGSLEVYIKPVHQKAPAEHHEPKPLAASKNPRQKDQPSDISIHDPEQEAACGPSHKPPSFTPPIDGESLSGRSSLSVFTSEVNRSDNVPCSPNSDSTDPMLDDDRAELLRIRTNGSPQQKPGEFTSITADSLHQSAAPISFSSHTFERLQTSRCAAVESLPSSPSSLDSLLSSSTSSVSTTGIVDKPEHGRNMTTLPRRNAESIPVEEIRPTTISYESTCGSWTTRLSSSEHVSNSSHQSLTGPGELEFKLLPAPPPPPLLPLAPSIDTWTKPKQSMISASAELAPVQPHLFAATADSKPSCIKSESVVCKTEQIQRADSQRTSSSLTTMSKSATTRYDAVDIREPLVSSLSSSSSSPSTSSLSSSSGSPYRIDCRNTQSGSQVGHHPSTSHASSETVRGFGVVTTNEESQNTSKTPKIVIRFGTSTSSGTASCTSSPLTKSTDPINLTESSSSQSTIAAVSSNIPHPAPLKLTISRDRLNYRGTYPTQPSSSEASNSDTSSSSDSSLSADDDAPTLVKSMEVHIPTSELPPPPCLERLPDRHSSSKICSEPKMSNQTSSRLSCGQSGTVTGHSAKSVGSLPPLLPLFPAASKPASLTCTMEINERKALFSDSRKRRHSTIQHGPLAKRRPASEERIKTSPLPTGDPIGENIDPRGTRVRVDSVFTDDEADGVFKLPFDSKTAGPIRSSSTDHSKSDDQDVCQLSASLAHSTPKWESSINEKTVDSKGAKGRPRTKHTANVPTHSYSPAVKTSLKSDCSFPFPSQKQLKGRPRTKRSSALSSCPNPSRGVSNAHRQTSQVVASAGSSYYFNNSGEQIWLCPVCLLEDDGNLMIGCDSCDDWYHSTCLGLTAEPEVPQWFCPKCAAGQRSSASAGTIHTVSTSSSVPKPRHSAHRRTSASSLRKPKR